MKLISFGPAYGNVCRYMRSKGYRENHSIEDGCRYVVFVKTIHNPEFPDESKFKGLVLVHKIEFDLLLGIVTKHWMENRGIPITDYSQIHKFEEKFEQCATAFGEIRKWLCHDWLDEAIAQRTKRYDKKKK